MAKKWLDGAMASASITVLAGLTMFAVSQPARAGFDWTPPPAKQAPPVIAAPAPSVDAERLDNSAPAPMAAPLSQEAVPMAEEPVIPAMRTAPAPVMRPSAPPAPVEAFNVPPPVVPQVAPPAPPAPEFAQAVGFGSDIPLVLAMRQIVPPDYSYSFDPGVDPGERVSWNGGKPWDEALADAVRPMGLEVVVTGHTVWLRPGNPDAAPMEAGKVRLSDAAPMPAPVSVPAQMPEPVPAPVYPPSAASAAREPMPLPLSISGPMAAQAMAPVAAPVPAAAYAAAPPSPAAPEEEPYHQSYPHRKRPDIVRPMEYAQEAPPAPAAVPAPPPASDDYTTDYSHGPVPLMKALPPAPPAEPAPPVPSASMAAAPAAAMAVPGPGIAPPPLNEAAARGPVMDPLDIEYWQAEKGASLKEVLGRWASTANVAMLWNSPYDYALPEELRMHGTFADAVTQLLMTYGMADPRPLGRLHPNLPGGPSVLVIENYTEATN